MEDQKISRKEDMNEKDIGRKDMKNSLYSAYTQLGFDLFTG